MFAGSYLPTLWRQRGDYEITRVELHKLMTKLKKNLIFEIAQNLLSAYWPVDMTSWTCAVFFIGGMKKQHDAILESFGTTEGIINSLTRLPSTTCSLLFSSFLLLKLWNFLFLWFLDLRNYSKSNFDLAAKSLSSKFFKSNSDLAAKRSSAKIF